VAACSLPFIRLGLGEIQPWDESLYVIRAQACLKFGAWLDQTQYAIGHLYSATHPPLGIWFIAISKYLFGDSTFAIRLPIALAASGSIVLLWLIVRKFASEEAALVAAVSLSTADLFLELSHRAQMECLILFFSLAAIYLFLIAIERNKWAFSVLSGILFGFGLLTKFSEAFFILPVILLLSWALSKPRAIRFAGIIIAIAIIIVSPWFVMMTLRHPDYWNHVYGSLNALREGNYAPSSLAWWYYLNRLLVGLPVIIIALFFRGSNRMFRASLIWLIILLLVLQFIGTRMPHFAFLMLAPGVLLLGASWDKLHEMPSKKFAALFILLLMAMAWSASEQIRLLITHRIVWGDIIFRPVGLICVLIALALSGIIFRYVKDRSRYAAIVSILLVGFAFAHLFSEEEIVFENGASQIASIVLAPNTKNNMVVIHADFPNEEHAPQLTYYTDGWNLGWIPGKTSRAITWDSAATNSYVPDSSKEFVIVTRFENRFYHPPSRETELWDSLTRKLNSSFAHEKVFRSYILYY
jgi:4-amino-4-deoxy-L-arabinose transferase-like glycosyltransferase